MNALPVLVTFESDWRAAKEILDAFAARDDIDFAYPNQRFHDHRSEGKPGARAT